MRARAYNAEEEEEEGLLTAYNKSQKVGKHNALSGNTTLGTRGPVCGSEHYTEKNSAVPCRREAGAMKETER